MSEREQFEQWLKDEGLDHCRLSSAIGWRAWQAARADTETAMACAYCGGAEKVSSRAEGELVAVTRGVIDRHHRFGRIEYLGDVNVPRNGTPLFTHPPAKVPEAKIIIDRVVSELEGGFVACKRCGDQEDTATLDCMSDLKRLQALLSGNPPAKVPEWITPTTDLPPEYGRNPVWYWDSYQGLMLIQEHEAYRRLIRSKANNPHWMPTGLKRPDPPRKRLARDKVIVTVCYQEGCSDLEPFYVPSEYPDQSIEDTVEEDLYAEMHGNPGFRSYTWRRIKDDNPPQTEGTGDE